MTSTIKRTQRDYSLAFKLAVVDQVEKGELTYKQAQDKYGIQGCSTVLVWLRKHGKLDWSLGTPPTSMRGQLMTEPTTLTPEQKIKALEAELEDTRMKAAFFEAIVEKLRTDYVISVGKKATRETLQEKTAIGYGVTQCCRYLGISRQAYYQQCQRQTEWEQREQQVVQMVQYERLLQPRVGTRKLQYLLNKMHQIVIGRDRLFRCLRAHRLLVTPKRAYHKTTHSHHRFRCHPNLLKPSEQQVDISRSEQVWVADITYLPLQDNEAYLSLVTDAWSRKIVGYHVDDNLKTDGVLTAYKRALKQRQDKSKPLIHHSDRGIQYCSNAYQAVHAQHGVTCSMTDGYDCYQNALAERVNGILKQEFLTHKPATLEEARQMVTEAVAIYNQRRPHLALKYKTPDEVHRAF
ncbi:IS3 family transposase [Shewanella bicestrii]|uniref:IS3 family transposase n=1 Tax=Shewanella bicestrii TaxID=2018305 RepID=A0A220UMT9_9GAMM|nr:IS3 family transposase [Shewanella bicestrii]ASK69226.1 IS3 family transposase [Shewanella bicestrii]